VLKNLAYLKYEHRELEIFKDVMELYGEVLEKEIFQYTVTGTEEYYETVGEYKQERCELNAFAAKWMASGTFKLEAIQHFQDALSEELFWEYNERHCRKLGEEATGSTMSTDDLFKIETMEDGDEFLWKGLLARRDGDKGTVLWFSTCQSCGKQETKEKKLLRCSRCSRACFYCNKECQKRDWKDHTHECKKRSSGV
jgi:hypothetical protein